MQTYCTGIAGGSSREPCRSVLLYRFSTSQQLPRAHFMTMQDANAQRLQTRSGDPTVIAKALASLVYLATRHDSTGDFFAAACDAINDLTGVKSTSVVQGIKGQWRILATTDRSLTPEKLPVSLLSEVLDDDRQSSGDGWDAAPLNRPDRNGRILLQPSTEPTHIDAIAAAVGIAADCHRHHAHSARRADRLAAILEMTAGWNQSRQTDDLLIQIAEASTRLLGAERATIFLPDAGGKELVGKPALGVEDNTLRIPAGTGVVGSVMETGEPVRVDDDVRSEQKQIDRSIDEQLGYQTRTILCVPMKDADGKTIGAFELINRNHGNFTVEDEVALGDLASHAAVAISTTQHVEHLETVRRTVATEAADHVELIGNCEAIEKLKSTIERIAGTDLAILITGENGTGKEVVAQLIHYLSDRRDEVLVAVNCAAITETLLESELFGHEKGAFTDAHQAREGKFELANGGTLFLDEIGDMSLGGQAKLLRVLEEKVLVRVGGSVTIPTSARVVAATNQNLGELVRDKKFREDLFFRLNVVTIELPALRDRGDDVLLLAEHFLDNFCRKARRETPKLSASARTRLSNHPWPGNVRELRNMMERLAYLSDGDTVTPDDLAFVNAPQRDDAGESSIPPDLALNEATKLFQCEYIENQIDRAGGNMTDAARQMGLHRSNLYRKMRQLGIGTDEA